MPRSADPTVPPVQIDGFDQLQPIGRGGFSYVFSARQKDFNRLVALKVLTFGLADERERRSFERECRAMGLVSQHPHIVTVFNAAFTSTKQPCIVMELYSGGTMGDRQKREGQLPVAHVLDVGIKIAGALQTAHDRGLLHRDIKPQNLFISEFGEPALGDFGISTLDDERSISGGGGLTVHYAPPEVLEGAPASSISDLYSFAATLYTLLEGSRPFAPRPGARQSIGELARRIMLEEPPRASRGDVPRSLAELLARSMAKRPEQRPASAAELGQELQRIQGELGLSVTALPLATPMTPRAQPSPLTRQGEPSRDQELPRADGDDRAAGSVAAPPPPPPGPLSAPAPGPSEPPRVAMRPVARDDEPAGTDGDDELGHTVTVGRALAPDAAPSDVTEAGAPSTSTRRVVLGTVAGVVCLLAVAVSLLVFGRDGGDGTSTTTLGPTTTQLLQVRPPAPQGVTVAPAAEPGGVVVAWQSVGEPGAGTRYQVRPQTADLSPQNTDQLALTVSGVPAGARPCFTVVAITADGRTSTESALACL